MWDLFIFAVIGLLAGAAARLWYEKQEPLMVLGTMLLGMVGSLLGGLISWALWPAVDGELYSSPFLKSLLGAVLVLLLWPWVAYARSINVPRDRVP